MLLAMIGHLASAATLATTTAIATQLLPPESLPLLVDARDHLVPAAPYIQPADIPGALQKIKCKNSFTVYKQAG